MRRLSARARLRRTYAVLAGVLWLLGIEVLPNLHLALHERPHTHAADGTVIVVTFDRDVEPHRHADGTVHTHDAGIEANRAHERSAGIEAYRAHSSAGARGNRRDHHSRGVLAIDHAPDTHVASGLAHRAAALHPASAPVLDAIAVDRVATNARYPETGRDVVALIATRDARGPPIA